ncbi:MAG: methyltransferase [Pedobacter sp.]
MKVNTDGVLLAALSEVRDPLNILDVGTGTGLIALMLAQKYPFSLIHAVEIDELAANTAKENFSNSPFSERIKSWHSSIENFWGSNKTKYDLIVSNPPFFINSLRSGNPVKEKARHTDSTFFEQLVAGSEKQLSETGLFYLILPLQTADRVKKICSLNGILHVQKEIMVHSFPESKPHRSILVFGLEKLVPVYYEVAIYEKAGIYTSEYRNLLKDYLTIF